MTTIPSRVLADLLQWVPVLSPLQTCREALRIMFQHPESKCMVICNHRNEPLGLLMSEQFYLKATGRHGTDSFYREPVQKMMNSTPLIAEIDSPFLSLLAEAEGRPALFSNDSIILTRKGKYAGVVYPSELF